MGKRRRNKQLPPQHVRGVDLTHVPDTSATADNPLSDKRRRKKSKERYEKVEPPFKNTGAKDNAITWSELGLISKIGGGIAAFFLTIVLPVVWFASSLNTNVETLQGNVKDIKDTTEELVNNSVKHSQRLDGLEKSVSEISRNLSSNNNQSSYHNEKKGGGL